MATTGLAALVALAVAIPLTLGAASPVSMKSAPERGPLAPFLVSVNGGRAYGPAHTFTVRPATTVSIDVELTVPANVTIAALWLGISTGTYGFTRQKGTYGNVGVRPIGIAQLLGRTRTELTAGRHTVAFRWKPPGGRSREVPLAADWSFTMTGPPYEGTVSEPIAQFAISP
jgi:hypothetical protein